MLRRSSTTICLGSWRNISTGLVELPVLETKDGKCCVLSIGDVLIFQRSVTLVGEADRKLLKAAIRHGSDKDKVRHRIVPQDAVNKWVEKLESLKEEISEILHEEKEEKQVLWLAIALYNLFINHLVVPASRDGAKEGSKHH